VEKEYCSRTGIFPVMHAVVIKRSVLDSHPWVAGSLMKAFEQSLRVAKEGRRGTSPPPAGVMPERD
jgi:4,5-dihydroxyphthalate decarboxylase